MDELVIRAQMDAGQAGLNRIALDQQDRRGVRARRGHRLDDIGSHGDRIISAS